MNLLKKASGPLVAAVAIIVLAALFFVSQWLSTESQEAQLSLAQLEKSREAATIARETDSELLNLKKADLETFKVNLETAATSKKSLFEAGVMLHDEKRLLEKQWDIMSTSVLIDGDSGKVTLLKDDVPVDTFYLPGAPIIYGSTPTLKLATNMRVTAKERFAHPERGKAETVNGVLQWTPPMVGTSVRANALGEFVVFTDSPLILHGPPTKAEDHAAYSHLCLNLSASAAKKLYEKTYIGTKITLMQTLPSQTQTPTTE